MQLNFVLGTAAELIKVYPLIDLAMKKGHQVRILSTGQSRENFLMQYRDLALPEEKLKWLIKSTNDLKQAAPALRWFLRALFTTRKSFLSLLLNEGRSRSFVVIHGDTLSTFVGARLARKTGLPIVHIEAGLRSASLLNPFPEEILRRLVSRFVQYHMAPDATAVANLKRSKSSGLIISTQGNTLIDAVRAAPTKAFTQSNFALVNVHRFENLNSPERWKVVVDTVAKAAQKQHVIFVAHPQTRHKLANDKEARDRFEVAGVEIRDRMPFTEFLSLLKQAEFLISDGGSNQEECSYLGKPCLLLRVETERQEGLGANCVLSKFHRDTIEDFLGAPQRFARQPLSVETSPTSRILEALSSGV